MTWASVLPGLRPLQGRHTGQATWMPVLLTACVATMKGNCSELTAFPRILGHSSHCPRLTHVITLRWRPDVAPIRQRASISDEAAISGRYFQIVTSLQCVDASVWARLELSSFCTSTRWRPVPRNLTCDPPQKRVSSGMLWFRQVSLVATARLLASSPCDGGPT